MITCYSDLQFDNYCKLNKIDFIIGNSGYKFINNLTEFSKINKYDLFLKKYNEPSNIIQNLTDIDDSDNLIKINPLDFSITFDFYICGDKRYRTTEYRLVIEILKKHVPEILTNIECMIPKVAYRKRILSLSEIQNATQIKDEILDTPSTQFVYIDNNGERYVVGCSGVCSNDNSELIYTFENDIIKFKVFENEINSKVVNIYMIEFPNIINIDGHQWARVREIDDCIDNYDVIWYSNKIDYIKGKFIIKRDNDKNITGRYITKGDLEYEIIKMTENSLRRGTMALYVKIN